MRWHFFVFLYMFLVMRLQWICGLLHSSLTAATWKEMSLNFHIWHSTYGVNNFQYWSAECMDLCWSWSFFSLQIHPLVESKSMRLEGTTTSSSLTSYISQASDCTLNTTEIRQKYYNPDKPWKWDDFIYLGSKLSSNDCSQLDILRRTGLAASAMKDLNRVWSQKKVKLYTKVWI